MTVKQRAVFAGSFARDVRKEKERGPPLRRAPLVAVRERLPDHSVADDQQRASQEEACEDKQAGDREHRNGLDH